MITWTCPPQIDARITTVSASQLGLLPGVTSGVVRLSYETILDPELPKPDGVNQTHLEVDPGGTVRHVLATTLPGEGS